MNEKKMPSLDQLRMKIALQNQKDGKPTPGPWLISWETFAGGSAHGIYAPGELDLKGHQIAVVNCYPTVNYNSNEETGKANARLIAASPSLFAAAEMVANDPAFNQLSPMVRAVIGRTIEAVREGS